MSGAYAVQRSGEATLHGHSTSFLATLPADQPRTRPPRSTRDVVEVLYRQAGLIVVCALLGAAASLLLSTRPPRVHVATAERERAAGHARAAAMHRIVGRGLKLELDPDAVAASGDSTTTAADGQPPAPRLRLDESRPSGGDGAQEDVDVRLQLVAWPPRAAAPQRGHEEIDPIAVSAAADARIAVDAPDAAASGHDERGAALPATAAGLLLGLLLAGLRELGGDRLRSAREVEWALGLPVLGAIPTLSARAREACLASPTGAPPSAGNAAAAEPA